MNDRLQEWPTGRLLATAARLVEHAWADRLQQVGLTHAGLVVLHVLGDQPASASELAARCRVEPQSITRTLDRLERDGLVERTADPADRRRSLIHRTRAGRLAWQRGVAAGSAEEGILGPLADDQKFRSRLISLIEQLTTPGRAQPRPDSAAGERRGADPRKR